MGYPIIFLSVGGCISGGTGRALIFHVMCRTLACLSLLLVACQVSDGDNYIRTETSPEGSRYSGYGAVLGEWEGLPASDLGNGVAQDILRIEPGKLSYVRTCSFADGTVIEVTASATAEIQQKNITVIQSSEATQSEAGHECTASLDAGVLGYGMLMDSMRLLVDGEFYNLTRAD